MHIFLFSHLPNTLPIFHKTYWTYLYLVSVYVVTSYIGLCRTCREYHNPDTQYTCNLLSIQRPTQTICFLHFWYKPLNFDETPDNQQTSKTAPYSTVLVHGSLLLLNFKID
jgi:hypothetical protein